jgi:hypothetical protein
MEVGVNRLLPTVISPAGVSGAVDTSPPDEHPRAVAKAASHTFRIIVELDF